MYDQIVRAVLDLNPPSGSLRKVVTWSFYESRALLTASRTSIEAYDKFFKFGSRIIGSSRQDLRYLETISFYEEIRYENTVLFKKKKTTDIIKIVRDGDIIIEFDVLP